MVPKRLRKLFGNRKNQSPKRPSAAASSTGPAMPLIPATTATETLSSHVTASKQSSALPKNNEPKMGSPPETETINSYRPPPYSLNPFKLLFALPCYMASEWTKYHNGKKDTKGNDDKSQNTQVPKRSKKVSN